MSRRSALRTCRSTVGPCDYALPRRGCAALAATLSTRDEPAIAAPHSWRCSPDSHCARRASYQRGLIPRGTIVVEFKISSFCTGGGCVEVGQSPVDGAVTVRDAKDPLRSV